MWGFFWGEWGSRICREWCWWKRGSKGTPPTPSLPDRFCLPSSNQTLGEVGGVGVRPSASRSSNQTAQRLLILKFLVLHLRTKDSTIPNKEAPEAFPWRSGTRSTWLFNILLEGSANAIRLQNTITGRSTNVLMLWEYDWKLYEKQCKSNPNNQNIESRSGR